MRSQTQQIFLQTPREKQVMMFSATLPQAIRPVVKKFMHNVRFCGLLYFLLAQLKRCSCYCSLLRLSWMTRPS